MPGSGKGEAGAIASSRHIPVFSMGDVVRRFFKEKCPGRDPIETGRYANDERELHGRDIWAKRLVDDVDLAGKEGYDIVMIDGLRSSSEAELFREHWGEELIIAAVHSSPQTRFERLAARGRSDDSTSREVFDERDRRELGWGLGDVISLADIILINEEDLDTFRMSISSLFDSFGAL